MAAKLDLASAIVARYHGDEAAAAEREWFVRTFSERRAPADMPVTPVGAGDGSAFAIVRAHFSPEEHSNSALRRLFAQGAVDIGDAKVTDPATPVELPDDGVVVRVGKRTWFRAVPRR
jgi:tyrosyl-tRNA synthetase